MKCTVPILFSAIVLLVWTSGQAADVAFRGQWSTWATLADEQPEGQLGMRYIPELSLSADLGGVWQLDGEGALNINGYRMTDDWHDSRSPDIGT